MVLRETHSAAQILGQLIQPQDEFSRAMGNGDYQLIRALNTTVPEQVITPRGLAYGVAQGFAGSIEKLPEYMQEMAKEAGVPYVFVSGDERVSSSITFPSGEQFIFARQASGANAAVDVVREFEQHLLKMAPSLSDPQAADRAASLEGGTPGKTPTFEKAR